MKILKMMAGLLIGAGAGLVIAALGVAAFTDVTLSDFFGKLFSAKLTDVVLPFVFGILSFALSIFVLITLHELGHLVCGLASGYKFVSFRVFNFTFLRIDGKLRVKRYAVAGTGGQCLLTPPDRPVEDIPAVLYNYGGVIANLIALAAVLPLMWVEAHPLVSEFALIFILTDLLLIITNGIPMKLGGVGNDGYNAFALRRNLASKRGMMCQLRVNALIQNGVRPKDMPAGLFETTGVDDYSNPLELAVPVMAASRLVDEMEYDEALRRFEELYSHKSEIMELYVKEIACELLYLRLVCGRTAEAAELLDDSLRKYIVTYRKVMSSKERVLCAVALYIDQDRAQAQEIYDTLCARKDDYLLQGEVLSDIALMEAMLQK